MLELIGKFIGSDEIQSSEVTADKTPNGADIIEITFKSGYKRIFSALTLENIVTDELSDANQVQAKKFTPVVKEFMKLIAEYDLCVGEVEPLMQNLARNIDNTFNRATNYLWSEDDSQFTAGFDPMYYTSLLQAHKVITSIPTNEPKE